MKSGFLKSGGRKAGVVAACGALLFALAGCESAPAGPGGKNATTFGAARNSPTTGRVVTRAELQVRTASRYFGDEAYAEVNSAWLKDFYDEFRAELFRLGVVGWDERFDCNRFVELYTGLAQAHFYRRSFHSSTKAQALAMGPYWYVRADGKTTHALVQVMTERGRVFIEPQTGVEVQLAPVETAFAYFQFF